ncbi:hypothetical protein [Salinibacterium sp. SWN248]|uniref:hypothetical protein n=1 Tax=Salinibacterium sp. SWN248 TaxID=2792056 RepID=UPI0018CF0116|nr:hypothetical protein [Salinibacterium sp. SWN248]MBH0023815.1 hypothetical protein [Salinibacterium sp. SWN248]
MLQRRASIALVLSVLLISGCSTAATISAPEVSPTSDEVAPNPTNFGLMEREYLPLPYGHDFYMPQLVGLNFADVRAIADEFDFSVEYQDASEADRIAWVRGNWAVVGQDPIVGTPMKDGEFADLLVLKKSESVDAIAATLRTDFHLNEKRFVGTVTSTTEGFGRIIIDDATIDLDLISPIAGGCASPSAEADFDNARVALEAVIPLGSRVLVVRSASKGDGFLHVLRDASDLDDAPANSANEELVSTGWWEPSATQFSGGYDIDHHNDAAVTSYIPKSDLSGAQLEYSPLIAAAANDGVRNSVGGLGTCRDLAENNLADAQVRRAAEEERQRLFNLEIERKIREGYFSCRDGDGDGICYER